MNTKTLLSAALAAVLFAGSAQAVTITNRDAQEHKLTVFEGEDQRDVMIKPNETIQNICKTMCGVRVNDDENNEFQIDENELVSIEEGSLYFDGDSRDQGSATGDQSDSQSNTQEKE